MRFKSLDLLRYGKFSGRVLDFRPDAALHIVYGPNEAGKSSALSAISDLLFGFPDRDFRYGFGHDNRDLRVGAELVARNGAEIRFRRRKARKNAIVSASDAEEPLAEDALSPFLGTLGRDVFERAFGLDTDALRKGADIMLHSSGEIGSLLFSAASGMMGLRDLRMKLDKQADGIFAQRKSQDRLFYQALDRYDAARKAERDHTLRADAWKKLADAKEELETRIAALNAERKATAHAIEHLSRLKRWQPLINEIDAERRGLADYADLDGLGPAAAADLRGLLDRSEKIATEIERVRRERERLSNELERISVNEKVLAASGRIQELYRELGSYRKSREDLPGVDRELAGHEAGLTQLARRLGLNGLAELEAGIPDETALAELRSLAEKGREIGRRRQVSKDALKAERETLESLVSDAKGHLLDPKPWRDQLSTLAPDIDAIAQRDALDLQIARLADDLRLMTARMRPAVETLDALSEMPLPNLAKIAAAGERLEAARERLQETGRGRDSIAAAVGELEGEIELLDAGGAIVTHADIAEARKSRDESVERLADAADRQASVSPQSITGLAQQIREADRLSDAALADAERLSLHAELIARRERLSRDLKKADTIAADAGAAFAAEQLAYETLFSGCRIAPLDPDAMLAWRQALDSAFEKQREMRDLNSRRASLDRLEERVLPALTGIADATGLEVTASLSAVQLNRALQRHMGELSDRWQESRALEGERTAARRRLEKLELDKAVLDKDSEEWRGPFSAAAARLGYSVDISVEAILAGLELWTRIPDALLERQRYQRRVAGMRRDIELFENTVRSLAAEIAPDLSTHNAAAAVEELSARAAIEKSRNEARSSLKEALEGTGSVLANLNKDHAGNVAALSKITAGLGGDLDGRELLKRLEERDRRRLRLSEARERYQMQAGGVAEEEARQALDSFDPVDADLELERLTRESDAQYQTFGELNAALAENRTAREAAETGISAELAVFEKHAAEEEASELARQWVVLKLASDILQSSLESYRQARADPMIIRAGERFSSLTDGAFVRLLQDYDDKDELQLLAERRNGEKVSLAGLSEGTGDQLYLALRLAFLEDYCSRNEPVPLIADDIFQTFDDDRTAAGLKTLALGAGVFQTVLFTHQQSVVEIAAATLGETADIIRL